MEALTAMHRYFILQISECLDKSWRHSQQCNAISPWKYLSALIKHGALEKMQRYSTLQIFEYFHKTWGTHKNATLFHSASI